MAQQVVIAGAMFEDVPSISVPDANNVYHPFLDTTIASNAAAASDIAQGKLAYVNGSLVTGTNQGGGSVTVEALSVTQNGTYTAPTGKAYSPVTVNVSGGGGGASNVVTGTFTTVSTRATNGTVSLPYTGSGYPIVLLVYINGGVYNGTAGGNTDFYNSVNRYDVGAVYITKAEMNTVPTYGTSGGNNIGAATTLYKNSTTNPATFAAGASASMVAYNSGDAGNNTTCVRFKGNGTTLSYKTGNLSASSIGLVPSTEYSYIVIYSS